MLKVLLGVINGDMSLDVTEQNWCRVAQGSCRLRIPVRKLGYGGYHPVVLAKDLLATLMAIEAHFTPTALRSPQAAQVRPTLLT